MESVFRLTRSNYYQLYIVDDASPNSDYLKSVEKNAAKNAGRRGIVNNVHTVRNETQKGFAGACKAGFEKGESPYVCFINSDCVIRDPGWLRSMGECLIRMKAQGVRVVSAATDNSVGGDPSQQQESVGKHTEDHIIGEDSFLSLYCFMCHRELFGKLGGFLKEYPFGYFEDEEFAARLRKRGYKQAVAARSWVHHEGQATIRPLWRLRPDTKDEMEIANRERCIADMKTLSN
jgi:GT2 family glycosyltransferase